MRRHSHKNKIAWQGAEKVRYFLYTHEFDVVETLNGKGHWIGLTEGTHSMNCTDSYYEANKDYLEVTAVDLPYLVKPEGEWEFRIPKRGDCVMFLNGTTYRDIESDWHAELPDRLKNMRWCKPRKVESYREWWRKVGSGMIPFEGHDMEEHARRVARAAWNASKKV